MEQTILAILPARFQRLLGNLSTEDADTLEEIRIRENRPLEVICGGISRFVDEEGKLSPLPDAAFLPNREDCVKLLEMLTHYSVYSFEEQLRSGYITVMGGHRVGLAGRTVTEHGKVKLLKEISSFNVRVAREICGAGRHVLPYLLNLPLVSPSLPALQVSPSALSPSGAGDAGCPIHHTLIVSPPRQGKTTLIRDLARLISSGGWSLGSGAAQPGCKVGIVDERSEIAACVNGVPRFDLGPRTDVLDGCPKAEGMMMMVRSMSPEVLVVDEIGRPEDAHAIREALHAGVKVIATAHGSGLDDVRCRPILRELIEDRVFTCYVVLGGAAAPGRLETVLDSSGKPIRNRPLLHWKERSAC
jgi:stage III sporulation protein AA